MITKAQIKHITSLHQGKFRKECNEFIAEGVKVVEELLLSPFVPTLVCAVNEWILTHEKLLRSISTEVIEVSPAELERISALSTPNRVLAVFQQPKQIQIPAFKPDDLVLVLNELKDPGNLGTIIRIADWFGMGHIVCSQNTVDVYNPKTIQSTMGSLARVKVYYTELLPFLTKSAENLNVFATLLEGENIVQADLPKGGLILIGSESHGLPDDLIRQANRHLTIPCYLHPEPMTGHAESLNASIAAAIVCSEFRRR